MFGRNGFFGYGYTNTDPSSPDRHGDRAVWWSTWSLAECPVDLRNIDREKAESSLKERHAGWKNDTIQTIIPNVEISSVWPTLTTPVLPYWYRHSAVLIGDAAHALQPTSGQGTSQALEDCEGLALLLAFHSAKDSTAFDLALQQYQMLRKPRVARIHAEATKRSKMKQDMSVVEEMIMYAVLWIMGTLPVTSAWHFIALVLTVCGICRQTQAGTVTPRMAGKLRYPGRSEEDDSRVVIAAIQYGSVARCKMYDVRLMIPTQRQVPIKNAWNGMHVPACCAQCHLEVVDSARKTVLAYRNPEPTLRTAFRTVHIHLPAVSAHKNRD